MKALSAVDFAVIGAFFAVMIGVGVYYSRRSASSAQFFGGDKSVPWWLSGMFTYCLYGDVTLGKFILNYTAFMAFGEVTCMVFGVWSYL